MDNKCCLKPQCQCSNAVDNKDKIKMSYAYCYVPIQTFEKLFEPENALNAGTLFKELCIPITEYGV